MGKIYTYFATSDEVSSVTGKYLDEKKRMVKSNKYTCQTENIGNVMDLTNRYLSAGYRRIG